MDKPIETWEDFWTNKINRDRKNRGVSVVALSDRVMRQPVLCAFEVDGKEGRYNVWRYDTPSTQCVLFNFKADSPELAKEAALEKISA